MLKSFLLGATLAVAVMTGLSACGSDEIEPKLSAIQAEIFTPTCALSACHDSNSPENGLDLTEGNAYTNLVNVKSPEVLTSTRVIPGDPDNSLLLQAMLDSAPYPIRQMPRGRGSRDEEIEAVREWIARGANND